MASLQQIIPTSVSLLGDSLVFERTGKRLIAMQPDAISIGDPDGDHPTTRLAIAGARALAAFPDQLWIATADDQLSRVDYAGRALAPLRPLPVANRPLLQPAPCGAPAAVWSANPALVVSGEDPPSTLDADLALPLTARRLVIARGRKLTLPSGLITMLPPNTTVLGGAVMTDGKAAVLVIAHPGGRELIVVALGTGQIGQRHALPSTTVRVAIDRGLAAAQLDPRTLRIIDLRAGRELGAIAFDRDIVDHALDPQGRRLVARDAGGAVELVELAELLRAAAVAPGSSVVRHVRSASDRETPPRSLPGKLAITARGRYAHGAFALPRDVYDEIELRSPVTHDVIGVFPCGTGDVDDAVASAQDACGHWASLALDARLAVLARIEAALARRSGELIAVSCCSASNATAASRY